MPKRNTATKKVAKVKPVAATAPAEEAQPGSSHPNCTKHICGVEDCHCAECAKARLA